METARLSLDVCCMRESHEHRNSFETETGMAVGMDNGLRSVFTTSVKATGNWNASEPAQIRRDQRTLQAWKSARCIPRTVAQRQTFSFGT